MSETINTNENTTPQTASPEKFRFHIGMRNIKTALAATLCALLYFPFSRNPTFACIGAVFGTGNDMVRHGRTLSGSTAYI